MAESLAHAWHAGSADEVLRKLDVRGDHGLSEEEVGARRARFGLNALTPARRRSALFRFLSQLHQPLIYILIAAGGITAVLDEWVDAAVIFGVVTVNALIGFFQESKALHAIDALARTLVSEATVIRSGRRARVAATELVPGDLVVFAAGDKIPADLRLLRTRSVEADESALTGESLPVPKDAEAEVAEDALLGDRVNLLAATSVVTHGHGHGVVVETGDRTEVGKISRLLSSADVLATPLTHKIRRFSHLLLSIILGLAVATFVVGTVRGEAAFAMFMAAVALMVGAIPEGLPAAVTIMLALGVSRMARRRAIIRKLPAVETLGNTDIICSDKTGTLTENQMTVLAIRAGTEAFEVTGAGYAPEGEVRRGGARTFASEHPALEVCLVAGVLCNDSQLRWREGRCTIEGDPTEGALLAVAPKAGVSQDDVEARYPRLDTVPFVSEHQYMATLHRTAADQRVVFVKGSVEAVLARSRAALANDGVEVALDARQVHEAAETLGRQGLRVLAFARADLPGSVDSIDDRDVHGLTFVGLQGMLDPPREEARVAVAECQRAGVEVKMITGDHAATAAVIARRLGIGGGEGEHPPTLTGRELAQLDEGSLSEAVERTAVFARVSPEQKLLLVRALQARGHVVAMTGDGVNDAPALRQANIGVAMGVVGTDVAKDAADMVLTDDNFASIEAAIEEGRSVFDNLTKFIVWTLPTNLGEALLILAAVALGTALPVLPVQLLWINMSTAVLLGLTLAFEPAEADIMRRPPRPQETPILDRALLMRTLFVGTMMLLAGMGLFELQLWRGVDIDRARTATMHVIVVIEAFYLFNCRSIDKPVRVLGMFSNLWVFAGIGVMMSLQLVITYAPPAQRLLGTASIQPWVWALIVAAGLLVAVLVGAEKRVRFALASRVSAQGSSGQASRS